MDFLRNRDRCGCGKPGATWHGVCTCPCTYCRKIQNSPRRIRKHIAQRIYNDQYHFCRISIFRLLSVGWFSLFLLLSWIAYEVQQPYLSHFVWNVRNTYQFECAVSNNYLEDMFSSWTLQVKVRRNEVDPTFCFKCSRLEGIISSLPLSSQLIWPILGISAVSLTYCPSQLKTDPLSGNFRNGFPAIPIFQIFKIGFRRYM